LSRSSFSFQTFALGALLPLALACQPEIGDSCSSASDCSVQEQRTCDTTSPGGYCTVLGCGPGTCPSEAVCIGFQTLLSVAPECASQQSRARLQRTLCMRECDGDSDCRGGYRCVDMSQRNPWGALVLERGGGGKVCTLEPPEEARGDSAVCAEAEPLATPAPLDAGRVDAGDGG
jgi:hypothetical protein